VKRLAVIIHVHVVRGRNTSIVTVNWDNYFNSFYDINTQSMLLALSAHLHQ